MKWIWKFVGKRRELPHKKLNHKECVYHNEVDFPDVLSNNYCKSCDHKMCYICSHPHFHLGCRVECKI